jgi:TolB-like protein/DNA-binding SARP family transcriptional activator
LADENRHETVHIILLGRFQLKPGGPGEVLTIPSRRRSALLAYLSMRPNLSETRERLATFLWGDVSDRQARQSLRQALVSLRADLGTRESEILRIERDQIALTISQNKIDARQFLSLSESDNPSDVLAAAELYKGPFLDGLNLDTEGFNFWLLEQRSRIEFAAQKVLSRAALNSDVSGSQAILFAERLLAVDPTKADAQKLLLGLVAKHHGRDRAIAEAHRIDRMLVAEFGLRVGGVARGVVAELNTEEQSEKTLNHHVEIVNDLQSNIIPSSADPFVSQVAARPSIPRTRSFSIASLVVGTALLLLFGKFILDRADSRKMTSETQAPAINPSVSATSANLSALGLNPIMVLPFTSPDTSRDGVRAADLLTDDLINDLSTVNAFRVISRSTSQLYKGRKIDVATIGAELGVRYVVTGAVKIENNIAQIDVELTDATSRLNLWSQRFEESADEIGAVRQDILRSIARQLQVSVYLAEDATVRPKPAQDPTLEELLKKGWASLVRSPGGESENPGAYFKEVLKLQPDNASAQLGYAGSQIVPATSLIGRGREFDLAGAERILADFLGRDPFHSTGLLYRGMLKRLQGDQTAARADFLLAIEHHPSFATAYAQAGYSMYRLGEFDRGLDYVRYAIRLSPRDPGLGVWNYFAGLIELERGNDVAAFDWLDRSVTLVPRNIYARLALASALALRGDAGAATAQLAELSHIAPWISLDKVKALSIGSPPPGSHGRLVAGLEKAFAAEK